MSGLLGLAKRSTQAYEVGYAATFGNASSAAFNASSS
jgi:hypothetical protein